MRIDLSEPEILTLILAVEHAKNTVGKGLASKDAFSTKDETYLRYATLEAKLKGLKEAAA
jgi:hypothetical protein